VVVLEVAVAYAVLEEELVALVGVVGEVVAGVAGEL
jgi:hypothetical protein